MTIFSPLHRYRPRGQRCGRILGSWSKEGSSRTLANNWIYQGLAPRRFEYSQIAVILVFLYVYSNIWDVDWLTPAMAR